MYEFSKALSRKKEFVKEVTELRASDCSQDNFNVLMNLCTLPSLHICDMVKLEVMLTSNISTLNGILLCSSLS